ncbi:hypothetical protein Sliba_32680 [Streptomyces nigrescens]|uniref:Uncharacterized protein n=1 Tax=Streptomyces nigrescens TaxID=1920 RepID=A0A640TLI1_STRNI|nr:hypothetical protein Sliba_32680 [Streptomyces libani subsp. libani]GGW06950.1 hypothetical protein GCM10010500_74640 [Streptomyces libani subsp. libani]
MVTCELTVCLLDGVEWEPRRPCPGAGANGAVKQPAEETSRRLVFTQLPYRALGKGAEWRDG